MLSTDIKTWKLGCLWPAMKQPHYDEKKMIPIPKQYDTHTIIAP